MDISIELVKKISSELDEPEWALNGRLALFAQAEKLPIPQSRYTKLPGFTINNFRIDKISAESKELEIRESDYIQINNDSKKNSKRSDKIVITDIPDAIRRYPELVKKYLFNNFQKSPVKPDKFELLTSALFRTGMFVYAPEGVKRAEPIYSTFILSEPLSLMFAPVIIVADKNAVIKIIETYNTTADSSATVLSANVYVFLEEGAHIEYISVRKAEGDAFSFATFRSFLKRGARLDWRHAWFGGRHQKANIINYLEGEGSTADEVQVFFLDKKEHLDITSRLLHNSPKTTSRVLVKGALRDRARAVFHGNVRIEKNAQETDSFLSDHVLLLNPGARADSIPGLEIEADQVRASHSASIGQIDEEQVFYLMSRGLDEREAKKTIVSGFISPAIDAIPDERVREKIWKSFESKW